MVLTEQKRNYLEKLSTNEGVISALAFDQRGALKRLMAQYQDTEPTVAQMEELKVLVVSISSFSLGLGYHYHYLQEEKWKVSREQRYMLCCWMQTLDV